MPVKRISTLCLALAVAITTLSCEDVPDPVSPVEPQFAKGGKPGKPVETGSATLLEYYVYRDGTQNFVHIVAEGSFPRVNLNVVQDYHFNGIRNNDFYYEYTTAAPLPVGQADAVTGGVVWKETDVPGTWHIDIPWNGDTWYKIYPDPDDPDPPPVQRIETFFPDFPHIELAEGGDPYAFDIRFQTEEGEYINYFRPQGIVLGGAPVGEAKMVNPGDFHGTGAFIYSYAAYATATTGESVFIADMNVDESSLTCEIKTILMRDGKVKWRETVREVRGTAQVVLSTGISGDPIPDAWIDVMFATGDPTQANLVETSFTTHGAESWAGGWGFGVRFPDGPSTFDIRLAVPYVYSSDLQAGTVYTPAENKGIGSPSESTGWFTINAENTLAEPDGITTRPFPIAFTAPITVTCGK